MKQAEYDQHNKIEKNETVLICYINDTPVSSGCFKKVDEDTIEIKRMYVDPSHRRKGISSKLLSELESWAKELNFAISLLETGKGQPEAIGLYTKAGYKITENYGSYIGIENSICMKKGMYSRGNLIVELSS
ncbi:GNAT family N-acetyltransferase [Desulfosarcina alkanivorans]|uniref:GNAT family N-acetyltransferase n=1 Tax=Desulfosarcina alkanivorans TaxID=571177 RepID=UPI0012D2EC59|nr:GNAT family N-acetyltransferase [Desulfosarcina alkanivorans]